MVQFWCNKCKNYTIEGIYCKICGTKRKWNNREVCDTCPYEMNDVIDSEPPGCEMDKCPILPLYYSKDGEE
jgi:hypothetical protein